MQGFMITLTICSVTMSVLALLYMAAIPFLSKRYSVTGCYYTWLVFVLGLIIPFRPQFDDPLVKISLPGNAAVPMSRVGNVTPVPLPVPVNRMFPSTLSNISWWQITAAAWLIGMVIFLSYHAVRHYRFLKLTARWSETITDDQTLTLLQNLKTQMGISRDIGLQLCYSIGSPMLIGFALPRILLPQTDFSIDELRLILKHELVHYQRKDLWYKCLVLIAAGIHWFNPIVHLMAKAIDVQCELSCDAEVVRSTGADTRLYYSKTIINVVRYKSGLKTALSTNFYGGKNGMKKRIFSIMDMSRKKTGAVVLCGALIFTLGTGVTFAANADAHPPEPAKDHPNIVAPWIAAGFIPSPDTYAPYASFGITISEDGRKLLYEGQPVRQFVDEKADGWAFYLDGEGNKNLSVIRNTSGKITGIGTMTAQKAQEYYDDFFSEELAPGFSAQVHQKVSQENAKDIAKESVQENFQESVQSGGNKYEVYQPFGITYSDADEILYFNGQRVKFFIDRLAGESPAVLWTDPAGTVNLSAAHDTSGRITGIESISDKKAQECQSEVEQWEKDRLAGLEDSIEAKMKALYPED